jgi:uncharacterized protein YgbK (DUF1537 family)
VLALIADDLTGAGDASVQFARRGWDTYLSLVPLNALSGTRHFSGSSVIAVTTDCRALGNDAARKVTAEVLAALMSEGIDRLFLKIDSTMRGSVPGQVAGALAAWGKRHPDARAFVCPAYPGMGRTVESGRLLVNGEPVERTAIGRDPVTPVAASDMSMLLPGSSSIRIFDAATDADLMAVAECISMAGRSVIPVGSGGLAEAVAEVWSGRDESVQNARRQRRRPLRARGQGSRILLQVSSLNPVSHTQVARLKEAFPDVVVLSPPAERADPAAVAAALAQAFAARLEREPWDVLGLVGGDGARATLGELGASGIRIIDSVIEGVPFGIVAGGRADGLPVFTKAGGFGAEDALVRCVEGMRS